MQKDLKKIFCWFNRNLLTVNYNKTTYLPFTSYQTNLPTFRAIQVKNGDAVIEITSSKKVKYLGIIIDCHLRWDEHVSFTVQKIRGLVYKFRKLKTILNIKELKVLYHALVETILQYGITVWGACSKTLMLRLQCIKKRVLKIIYGLSYRFPTDQLYEMSQISDLKQLYAKKIIFFVSKNISKFDFIDHTQNTRMKESRLLKIPKMSKSIGQKYFMYIGPKLYNVIPDELKLSNSSYSFKKMIRKWILENRNMIHNILN